MISIHLAIRALTMQCVSVCQCAWEQQYDGMMRARHIQLKMVNFICFWHSHRYAFVATWLSVSHYTHIESHKRWHEKQFQPLITTFTDIKFISNRYSVGHTLTAWTLAALSVHTESDSREIWSTSTSQSTKNKVLSIHVLNLLNDIYYIAAANENHFRQIFVCHFGILSLPLGRMLYDRIAYYGLRFSQRQWHTPGVLVTGVYGKSRPKVNRTE